MPAPPTTVQPIGVTNGISPVLVDVNGQKIPTEFVPGFTPGGSALPLLRERWVDANTTIAVASQNGAPSTPYGSVPLWLADTTVFPAQPASVDDASAMQVALLAPAANDVWPAAETWTIPNARNLLISSLQATGPSLPQGATFVSPTITWANTVGAFAPANGISVLAFTNIVMSSAAFVVTDGAGSSLSRLVFTGASCSVAGTLNVSGASSFNAIQVSGATVNFTSVTNPGGGPTWGLNVSGGSWASAGLRCTVITAANASFTDTGGFLQTTGAQSYTNCAVTANGLRTSGVSVISFVGCTFTRATVITTATGSVSFDGPSYAEFLAAGGTFGASTIVTVVGGFSQGAVAGANVNDPAGNACTVSVNGTGASAGFTGGGNWYTATALAGNTNTTISDAGGAVNGATMRFTRTDASGNTWTILDATAGSIASVAAGGSVTVSFNGTAWVLQ